MVNIEAENLELKEKITGETTTNFRTKRSQQLAAEA